MSLLQTADMERILAELSDERPVFHSEADFQFALALKMQQLRTPRGQDDCWRRGASVGRAGGGDGTKKGREEPITLRGDYTFHWRRYSNCLTHPRVKPFEDELTRYAEFRYLLVRVPPRE
jgi:hypothetical protein